MTYAEIKAISIGAKGYEQCIISNRANIILEGSTTIPSLGREIRQQEYGSSEWVRTP